MFLRPRRLEEVAQQLVFDRLGRDRVGSLVGVSVESAHDQILACVRRKTGSRSSTGIFSAWQNSTILRMCLAERITFADIVHERKNHHPEIDPLRLGIAAADL